MEAAKCGPPVDLYTGLGPIREVASANSRLTSLSSGYFEERKRPNLDLCQFTIHELKFRLL
eukprot:10095484-Karenia_brevis.AAC.1